MLRADSLKAGAPLDAASKLFEGKTEAKGQQEEHAQGWLFSSHLEQGDVGTVKSTESSKVLLGEAELEPALGDLLA